MKQISTIDEYIASFPQETRKILENIRGTIRKAAPDATEAMAYGLPTFRLKGNLVHFGAFKDHVGFYPAPSGIQAFKDELTRYQTGKGTLQFPISEPIPYDLIAKVTKHRVEESSGSLK